LFYGDPKRDVNPNKRDVGDMNLEEGRGALGLRFRWRWAMGMFDMIRTILSSHLSPIFKTPGHCRLFG
jgi:hypothetical protein